MEQTVRFRVLIDHEVKKLTLSSEIPSTVEELVATVKESFSLPADASLQYKDEEFDDFFTLTSTNELKDKDTLKVVYVCCVCMGCPELLVNSLSHKSEDEQRAAKNVKKPKRADVNYLPSHPHGETDDTLENLRLDLVEACQKKDSAWTINDMMARTHSWRRQEVVSKCPAVGEFKERWPALFEPFQINEEFRRCTAVQLESTFMSQLDRHTPKLLELFSVKGGATGQRIKCLLMELIQDPSASTLKKRDVTLRSLIEYMGESASELISDYRGTAETTVHEDLKLKNMGIYICHEPDAIGIIIEGVPVLTNVGNLAKACCLLLGLAYALNLEYPSKLSKTFEVFQRLFVGLDTLRPKPSPKFMTLKNKLLT